jgi:hypothetical protein
MVEPGNYSKSTKVLPMIMLAASSISAHEISPVRQDFNHLHNRFIFVCGKLTEVEIPRQFNCNLFQSPVDPGAVPASHSDQKVTALKRPQNNPFAKTCNSNYISQSDSHDALSGTHLSRTTPSADFHSTGITMRLTIN